MIRAATARPGRVLIAVCAIAAAAAGCATTGSTFGSGVGDSFPSGPPYYAGARAAAAASLGHLPVVFQAGASQPAIFDPGHSDDMNALLADMTAFLDSLGVSLRLVEGGGVSAVSHAATANGPDVQFGCPPDDLFPDECAEPGDGVLGRDEHRMRLAVGRPSSEWTAWAAQVMADQGVDRVLVVTLEVGQYLVRQRGLVGNKDVELGTGHTVRLPWLTSLETPVSVLQLTGAVMGPDGKAVRIGAEGLVARRTPILASGLGAQALISDEDVASLRTARREDLAGQPLVWQEGLRQLVGGLLGPTGG